MPFVALDDAGRLREEDPFSARWTTITDNRVVVHRSRFEVDLNRPREKAVYRVPADAWGLRVWNTELPELLLDESRAQYDSFYNAFHDYVVGLLQKHDRLVVYDLHTYNHRRDGPDAPPADPIANPEVNVGTGTMPPHWGPVASAFISTLRDIDFDGHSMDVRENVKFQGGNFARWIHTTFPDRVCALSIEFKKTFMDEWTGTPDESRIDRIHEALSSTIPGVLEALRTA